MGLLDSVIGGVLGQVLGGGRGNAGGAGGAMSPIVKALLMLLLAKGASGGLAGGLGGALGDVFGGGQRRPEPGPDTERSGGAGPYGRDPGHSADDGPGRDSGDIGGFDQEGGQGGGRRDAPLPPGDFSDLSGMLDGPGDRAEAPRSGHASSEPAGDLGGLDGLVDRFRQGGLGDVMDSWIGHGGNRSIAPHDLAQALGPDTLGALQSQTGMDRDSLLSQLSQVLPEVVHGLTPQGRVPDAGERRGW